MALGDLALVNLRMMSSSIPHHSNGKVFASALSLIK